MILDSISLAVGGGVLLIGFLLGLAFRRKPEQRVSSPTACGCGHELAVHDLDGGTCHAEVERWRDCHECEDNEHAEWVPCPCRRYTGQLPLPSLEDITKHLMPPPAPVCACGVEVKHHKIGSPECLARAHQRFQETQIGKRG